LGIGHWAIGAIGCGNKVRVRVRVRLGVRVRPRVRLLALRLGRVLSFV